MVCRRRVPRLIAPRIILILVKRPLRRLTTHKKLVGADGVEPPESLRTIDLQSIPLPLRYILPLKN